MTLETETTLLYLIRHGATSANEQVPYILQGCSVDLPLSPTGKKQAEDVGQLLKNRRIDAVYASRLQRARETAEHIAIHHQLQIETLAGIEECDVGDWEKLDWGAIRERYPEAYRRFQDSPYETPYLGGESYQQVFDRAWPALADLLERHRGQTVAVVSHNVVCRVVLAELLGLEKHRAKELRQVNGGVNVIQYREGQASLLAMNALFHLREFVTI